jgi:hypothetical protein
MLREADLESCKALVGIALEGRAAVSPPAAAAV